MPTWKSPLLAPCIEDFKHPNVNEKLSFRSLLKHLAKTQTEFSFWALLDSRVTIGCKSKGRSSSQKLNFYLSNSSATYSGCRALSESERYFSYSCCFFQGVVLLCATTYFALACSVLSTEFKHISKRRKRTKQDSPAMANKQISWVGNRHINKTS